MLCNIKMALPKLNRIKKKNDFDAIFKKGFSAKNNLFILKFLKNNLKEKRFGFIVSLKVSKKAVERNKLRRRLSEIIKKEIENIKEGLDMVFIALPSANKKEFLELKDSVENLFKISKCLKQ